MPISFNPMTTTGINDAFVVDTGGYISGTFLDDPNNRYNLEGGQVAAAQAQPLWGGLPISLGVPNADAYQSGPSISLATSLAAIAGWSLFNSASAGIITPSSNVPLYSAGMSANFGRAGSDLRIVLPVESTTILDALQGAAPNVDLYWDPANYCLTTSSAGTYGPLPVQLLFLSSTSETVSYSSASGNAIWVPGSPAAVVRI